MPKPSTALLLAAVIAASSPVAAASNQFDLVCKGTEQKRTGVPAVAWSERFRFDLDAKRWCRGACKSAADIASVTADQVLVYDSRASIGGPNGAELAIDRTDASVREYISTGWSGRAVGLAEGRCERDQFSGFPFRKL